VCLAFIFGALLEFALVNYAARKDMMLESRGRMRSFAGMGGGGGGGGGGGRQRPVHTLGPDTMDEQTMMVNNAYAMVIPSNLTIYGRSNATVLRVVICS